MVSKKIKVSTILDTKKIKKGDFTNQIPEFYELEKVIENNDWHDNDSVFNHTLTVLSHLEKILKKTKKAILRYLDKKIDSCTRKEILFLATIFHDIAKKEAIVREGTKTRTPGHEKEGAKKVRKILPRFNLSYREKGFIAEIIKNHDTVHLFLKSNTKDRDKSLSKFKDDSNVFWEVMLLGMADTLGCQPKGKVVTSEVKARMKFYKKLLFNS
jgi:UTP:GlnB (protein PII) uridylyltransferase